MVLPDSHRISRVPRYSGTLSRKICSFRLRDYHPLWLRFPADSTINRFCNFPRSCNSLRRAPQPRLYNACRLSHILGLGCSPFARHYLGNHCCFLFLKVLRCFSSLRSPLLPMYSAVDDPVMTGSGFPIQKSPDQSLFSGSPRLIAANHVLHRLLAPRHPPYALSSLTINIIFIAQLLRYISQYAIVKEHEHRTYSP